MKKHSHSFWPVFLFVLLFFSCKKDPGPSPESHEYYQPVAIGNWYRYAIDSVWWENFSNVPAGQVGYTLFESFDTDVPNNAGKLETRIKLEKADSLPRRLVGFSYIQRYYDNAKQEFSVERVDNNIRYVLFKAPFVITDTFNRNMKNTLPNDVWYNYSIGTPGGGAGGSYDRVMRLVRQDYADSLGIRIDYELYAFNVGLFYKEVTYIFGRTDTANWQNIPVMNRISSGYSYKKVLVDRGTIQ